MVVGVLVTQALERRRAARIAAWSVEPTEDDDIIELDERDVWVAPLPPAPPERAFQHHVHHAV
ncbi:MAG TPA: hypothetical protein VFQ65_01940 [Kofleriaceae bacterium]|nr:hypothetical protein [Kofleriaceae bacterium]